MHPCLPYLFCATTQHAEFFRFIELSDVFAPVFQDLLHESHELISNGAIDDTMVIAERQVNEGPDGDRVVPMRVGYHDGRLRDSADSQDGDVRLIDNGKPKHSSELTRVRYCESSAFHILRCEFFRARAFPKISDATLQAEKILLLRIFQNRDNESPIERDRDSHVDVLVIMDGFALERAVDNRKLLQRNDGCPYK